MKQITFNKNSIGQWFADIPEWTGDKAELEMIMGADTFLDIMAQGESKVTLSFNTEYLEGSSPSFVLKRNRPYSDGYYYDADGLFNSLEIWLCHVTEFVFGKFPETFYIYI